MLLLAKTRLGDDYSMTTSDKCKNNKFQIRVDYYDHDGKIIKSEIQEVPADGKYHTSKVVKELKK